MAAERIAALPLTLTSELVSVRVKRTLLKPLPVLDEITRPEIE